MSAAVAVGAAPAARRGRNRAMVTVCLMAATIMQALDTTIANVALPYMQGGLSATQDQVSWVLTSYIVAAAIMTAPVGWLAVRFGRKKVLVVCAAGFTLASMLCGVAQSIGDMVAYRLLQGVFGAALVPLSQAVMMDLYPPERRGQAMAIWGMGVMLGPIMGPTLGGWLTDALSWHWVFFVNLPFGIATVLGLLTFMEESETRPGMGGCTGRYSLAADSPAALRDGIAADCAYIELDPARPAHGARAIGIWGTPLAYPPPPTCLHSVPETRRLVPLSWAPLRMTAPSALAQISSTSQETMSRLRPTKSGVASVVIR